MKSVIIFLIVFSTPLIFAEEQIEWQMGNYVYDESSRCYPEPFEGCALPENFSCDSIGNGQCLGNDGKMYFMIDVSDIHKQDNQKSDEPQFGIIALMLLAISITCIIIVSAKTKVIPRF